MSSKNEVSSPDTNRSALRSVRKVLRSKGPAPSLTHQEELSNLRGLPAPQQKAVQALLAKIQVLDESGMHSSARRLESQALQIVRRHRRDAKSGPNWLTGV